jgi:uncharacterized membrane protein
MGFTPSISWRQFGRRRRDDLPDPVPVSRGAGDWFQTKLFRGPDWHGRSLAKAVSWRAVGTVDTFIVSFFVTGKVSIAGSIAAVEIATKIMIYYFHERLWTTISWGRR